MVLAQRCESVNDFFAGFAGGEQFCAALYAEDLSDMGEIEVVVEGGTGLDVAEFQTTMRLVNETVPRGGKIVEVEILNVLPKGRLVVLGDE